MASDDPEWSSDDPVSWEQRRTGKPKTSVEKRLSEVSEVEEYWGPKDEDEPCTFPSLTVHTCRTSEKAVRMERYSQENPRPT